MGGGGGGGARAAAAREEAARAEEVGSAEEARQAVARDSEAVDAAVDSTVSPLPESFSRRKRRKRNKSMGGAAITEHRLVAAKAWIERAARGSPEGIDVADDTRELAELRRPVVLLDGMGESRRFPRC